jgi:hypothetical protein
MAKKRGTTILTASNKKQGQEAKTGKKAEDMQKHEATLSDRGDGSSYAYAVQSVMEEAKNIKGSSSSFLGVDKEIIEPKELGHAFLGRKKGE